MYSCMSPNPRWFEDVFHFMSLSLRVWLNSLQEWPTYDLHIFCSKTRYGYQKRGTDADFESVDRFAKNAS
jgi:hypothetical protein